MDVPSYDAHATGFDTRAGLGAEVCQQVAAHVAARAGGAPVVEWGCGTGEIGVHLHALTQYAGFDRSEKMLEVVRTRQPDARLICADGDQPWPVADGAAVVFGSRSLHLMAAAHVAAECRRVARCVLVGRVERDPESLRDRMRRQMQELLRARGYRPRDGRSRSAGLASLLPFEAPVRVVSWTVAHSPGEAIAAWRGKPGLAGITPDPGDKREILDTLAEAFGDPQARVPATEWYTVAEAVLEGPS